MESRGRPARWTLPWRRRGRRMPPEAAWQGERGNRLDVPAHARGDNSPPIFDQLRGNSEKMPTRCAERRLQCNAPTLQAEDLGAGALRMDHPEIELLLGGEPWNWEDAYFDWTWPCRVPRGHAGAFLHGGRTCEPAGRVDNRETPGPLPRLARS